jgi:hypothetical protein
MITPYTEEELKTLTAEEVALHIAARCWCDEETGGCVMDTNLAQAFAKRLLLACDNNLSTLARLATRI